MEIRRTMFLLLSCTLFLLAACVGEGAEGAAAAAFLKEYKHAQLDVQASEHPTVEKRTNKIKPYVTDEVFEQIMNNRLIELPLKAAEKQGADIAAVVSDIEVKASGEDAYDLSYVVILKLSGSEGSEEAEIKFHGQSTVERIDGDWKVTRDYYRTGELLRWLE
jgi:hypothetical protein